MEHLDYRIMLTWIAGMFFAVNCFDISGKLIYVVAFIWYVAAYLFWSFALKGSEPIESTDDVNSDDAVTLE